MYFLNLYHDNIELKFSMLPVYINIEFLSIKAKQEFRLVLTLEQMR